MEEPTLIAIQSFSREAALTGPAAGLGNSEYHAGEGSRSKAELLILHKTGTPHFAQTVPGEKLTRVKAVPTNDAIMIAI